MKTRKRTGMRRIGFSLSAAVGLSEAHAALAHPGLPIAPHDLWSAWNTDFWLLLILEFSLFVYLWGVWQLWRRAGVGHGLSVWRLAALLGGLAALVVALVSPLDALSGALFSAHMAQHMVLIMVAAPLLVLSDFPKVILWALSRHHANAIGRTWNRAAWLRQAWRLLSRPLVAWTLFALTFWIWHAPAFYQAALRDQAIHEGEHVAFLLTAMLYWWAIVDPSRPKTSRYGIAVPYLFSTAMHTGILGALLTFATQLWYPLYAASAPTWGLTPLQDQQLAGVVMWVPGGAVFTLLSILYFGAWFGALERRSMGLKTHKVL